MLFKSGFCAAFAASAAAAALVPRSHVVHEERDVTSTRWMRRDRVRPEALLPVRIGLAQRNLEDAEEYLMDVSHPSSPNYGKHWTSEEVIDFFKPSDETVETVRQWLIEGGIPADIITHSDNKAWLAFHAPSKQVESLLHTEYHEYEDLRTGGVLPACDRYHLPKHIQKYVDYITPGVKLLAPSNKLGENSIQKRELVEKRENPHRGGWPGTHGSPPWRPWPGKPGGWPHPGGPGSNDLKDCDIAITPACIAALYHIPPGDKSDPTNTMGVFEAELQYWDQEDLNLFFTNFTRQIPNGTHPINHDIDGGVAVTHNLNDAGGESMLDLELVYPIVYPQTVAVWNVDDIHYQTWANDTYTWGFNTLLDAIDGSYCKYSAYGETGDLPGVDPTYPDPGPGGYNGKLQCGVYKPTNVFTLSYGGQEVDVPISYQRRQCNEYMKLGLQGITFVFASGDSGIGNYPPPYGFDGPTGCLGPKHNIFNPTWPNSCPYVLNVGATKVYPGRTVYEPESAVYDPAGPDLAANYSSGGGFSNVFPIPSYQKSAVNTFFTDHDPKHPYYSALATTSPSSPYILPNVTALAGMYCGAKVDVKVNFTHML